MKEIFLYALPQLLMYAVLIYAFVVQKWTLAFIMVGGIVIHIGIMIHIAGGNSTVWFCLGVPWVLIRAIRAKLMVQKVVIILLFTTSALSAQIYNLSDFKDLDDRNLAESFNTVYTMVGKPISDTKFATAEDSYHYKSDNGDYIYRVYEGDQSNISICIGTDWNNIITFYAISTNNLIEQKVLRGILYSKYWLPKDTITIHDAIYYRVGDKTIHKESDGYFSVGLVR